MLEFCGRKFTCDECPICEGIEHRLRVAREGGYEPQLEYCGCDKVQTEFFISGYCSDAFEADKPQGKLCEPRKTGRAYRRKMRKQKKEKLMRIMTYGYKSSIGYHEAIIPRELWLEVQQILKGENVVPVPSVDEVADLSASDVPRILDGFFVIKPRKDGNNEYLRQL